MNSTRKQRREFVNNAKRQWKRGEITEAEFLQLKKQISDLGREQGHANQQAVLEAKVDGVIEKNRDILEDELVEDDFAPDDL